MIIDKIYVASCKTEVIDYLKQKFEKDIYVLDSVDQFYEEFQEIVDGQFPVMLCGPEWGNDFCLEFAQICKNQSPSSRLHIITSDIKSIKAKDMYTNGYDSIKLWPMDKAVLEDLLLQEVAQFGNSEVKYKEVQLFDIAPDTELTFDVYIKLNLNGKHIKYCKAGEPMGADRHNKLIQKGVGSLHIDYKDSKKFYQYVVDKISEGGSPTVRRERFKEATSQMFLEMFDNDKSTSLDKGKEMLDNIKNTVNSYISFESDSNWYANLLRTIGPVGNLAHATDVAALAALFGLCLDYPDIQGLSIAALMQDISLLGVDPDTFYDDKGQPTPLYKRHPQNSINMIAQKKMIVSDEVKKAIEQSHEQFNGRGFPKGLTGDKICMEAQLLMLANLFYDELNVGEYEKAMSFEDAFDSIKRTGMVSSLYIRSLKNFFLEQRKQLEQELMAQAL